MHDSLFPALSPRLQLVSVLWLVLLSHDSQPSCRGETTIAMASKIVALNFCMPGNHTDRDQRR